MSKNYDKGPVVAIKGSDADCASGWDSIAEQIAATGARVVCVECYPGAFDDEIADELGRRLGGSVSRSKEYLKSPAEVDAMLAPHLTEDPVFGRMNGLAIADFFHAGRLQYAREAIERSRGRVLIVGTGAVLLAPDYHLLVYADMARWEIQGRQRRGEIGNFGADNRSERASLQYKRAFFVDWRAADRLKKQVLPKADFVLDTNEPTAPKIVRAAVVRAGLQEAVRRPFRVVPLFDPGPWGGQWMRSVCDLPDGPANYAWCFDCVPEENSLLLRIAGTTIELPAIDLAYFQPRDLLGDAVHGRFGTEFPIRFDLLDTMGGGNLSLQVHPLTEYIQDRFGMNYTQDESYYILDAGEDACVYLGLNEAVDACSMLQQLDAAQRDGPPFDAAAFVNRWPAKKHDHFSIPAGTVHCSGRNTMVLEISATPYIFTFKLWDWERLGLDGRPRPIHLEHGRANIQWDRTTKWVQRNLVCPPVPVTHGDGWCEERTGLQEREFIETRRHWFSQAVPHDTRGGVNVLNLVEGAAALVESPDDAFEPFEVHYAETFIVPAAVGPYTIRPLGEGRCATVKAFVRTNA